MPCAWVPTSTADSEYVAQSSMVAGGLLTRASPRSVGRRGLHEQVYEAVGLWHWRDGPRAISDRAGIGNISRMADIIRIVLPEVRLMLGWPYTLSKPMKCVFTPSEICVACVHCRFVHAAEIDSCMQLDRALLLTSAHLGSPVGLATQSRRRFGHGKHASTPAFHCSSVAIGEGRPLPARADATVARRSLHLLLRALIFRHL